MNITADGNAFDIEYVLVMANRIEYVLVFVTADENVSGFEKNIVHVTLFCVGVVGAIVIIKVEKNSV